MIDQTIIDRLAEILQRAQSVPAAEVVHELRELLDPLTEPDRKEALNRALELIGSMLRVEHPS
jgi:hypothetical protein